MRGGVIPERPLRCAPAPRARPRGPRLRWKAGTSRSGRRRLVAGPRSALPGRRGPAARDRADRLADGVGQPEDSFRSGIASARIRRSAGSISASAARAGGLPTRLGTVASGDERVAAGSLEQQRPPARGGRRTIRRCPASTAAGRGLGHPRPPVRSTGDPVARSWCRRRLIPAILQSGTVNRARLRIAARCTPSPRGRLRGGGPRCGRQAANRSGARPTSQATRPSSRSTGASVPPVPPPQLLRPAPRITGRSRSLPARPDHKLDGGAIQGRSDR